MKDHDKRLRINPFTHAQFVNLANILLEDAKAKLVRDKLNAIYVKYSTRVTVRGGEYFGDFDERMNSRMLQATVLKCRDKTDCTTKTCY